METKIILDKNTFEVKAQKVMAFQHPTVGGYALIAEADYWITTHDGKLCLKSDFEDEVYYTEIENLDTTNRTFEIKNKQYKYKIVR